MKALPLEQRVDCGCTEYLISVPVFLYNRYGEQQVYACLGCGAVSCVLPMGDEQRGGGPAGGNNFVVPLGEDVREWLGLWPRLLTLGRESNRPIWAAAGLRLSEAAALRAEVERAELAQAEMSGTDRLRGVMGGRALIPEPPAGLPAFLHFYRMAWEAVGCGTLGKLLQTSGCER